MGNAVWGADVATETEAGKVTKLSHGTGALRIRGNGTIRGAVVAGTAVESSFLSESFHVVTTQCEPEQVDVFQQCSDSLLSPLDIFIKVSGERGEPLEIDIDPKVDGAITLVPSLQLECVEPLIFPEADCTPDTIMLNRFTRKLVEIPFNCTVATFEAPPGYNYTTYFGGSEAHGVVNLKRTKGD